METQNINCPQCGAKMKFVPPGISKKGKPYRAFFSCSNCGYTFNAPGDISKMFANQKPETEQERIERLAKEKQERIQQLHNDKKENINWTSAMKEAVNLVANHPLFKDIPDEKNLWFKILTYRDMIYKEYIGLSNGIGIESDEESTIIEQEDNIT